MGKQRFLSQDDMHREWEQQLSLFCPHCGTFDTWAHRRKKLDPRGKTTTLRYKCYTCGREWKRLRTIIEEMVEVSIAQEEKRALSADNE